MMRTRQVALLSVALELLPACARDGDATSKFTTGPIPGSSSTSTTGAGGTSTGSMNAGSGSSTGEDSGGSASASGSSSSSSSIDSTGPVPDFGAHPIGCQGKIDFLFVIESWYAMKTVQLQLQEAFPAFTSMLDAEFADFDYHIMVVDAAKAPVLQDLCDPCYMCIGCTKPGCADFGGPEDYPCNEILTDCDVTAGAGVTITGNFGATNKRCELFGGNRYIIKGETALEETFKCIATLGEGPKTGLPMRSMMAALEPDMVNGGCNDGFLRDDALLAVIVLAGMHDNGSPGTPQDWYDAVVAAKKGNEDAIVTLVMSNDLDLPDYKCPGEPAGPNPLRLFAEAAKHGRFETICTESFVPALKATAETILEQCSLLIPK